MHGPASEVSDIIHYLWLFGLPVLFIIIVIFVFWPWRKRNYREDAQLPFQEDEDESGREKDGARDPHRDKDRP